MGGHGHSHDHDGGHGHSHDHDNESKSSNKKKKSHGGHGHSHSHGHGHSHGGGDGEATKFLGCCFLSNKIRISIMLCMTFFFFVVELVAGQITKSTALVTDSFHMLSDSLALIIGLVSIIMSSKKSAKNTFGWVRAEVLGALVNSVFLVSLCLGMVIEVVERLIETEEIKEPKFLLIVGFIGLLINLIGLFVFGHSHSHNLPNVAEDDDDDEADPEAIEFMLAMDKTSSAMANGNEEPVAVIVERYKPSEIKEKNGSSDKAVKKKPTKCHILSKEANMNMRAVFLHVLADALGSVIVIISALLNVYQEKLNINKTIILYIDPVLTLLLIILILVSAIPLLKDSALILLQTVPKEIEIKKLKQDIVKKIPGILSVHELHVWKLSGNKIIATAHVTCHNSHEYMKIATDLKAFFHKRGIHSTTFQPEFTDPVDGVENNCILECNKDCNLNTCCGQTNANANSSPSNDANNQVASGSV